MDHLVSIALSCVRGRIVIDTYPELVIFMRLDSRVGRSEGFREGKPLADGAVGPSPCVPRREDAHARDHAKVDADQVM